MILSKNNRQLLIEQKFLDTKFKNKELEEDPFSVVAYGKGFHEQKAIFNCIFHGTKYEKKIIKLMNKYDDFYNSIDVDETDFDIELSKEKNDSIFFTNAFDKKLKDIIFFSTGFEEEEFIEREKDTYIEQVNEKVAYSLRPSKLSNGSVVVERNNEKVMVVALSATNSLTIKGDNLSEIVLCGNNQITFVYSKSYIDSLDGKEPDTEKCLAYFIWDIIDKNELGFFSSLTFYDFDFDNLNEELFSLIFLLAIAPGLIYKNVEHMNRMLRMGIATSGARTITMMRH